MDYAENMRTLFICMTLILFNPVSADVYRTFDENGNVVFTDKPSPGAEKIKIDEVKKVSQTHIDDFEYTPAEQPKASKYTKHEICKTKRYQVFTGGAGDVTISVLIQPELRASDRLILYMDGQKQADSRSTSFSLTNIDRGTHTTKVDVVNEGGKSVKSSAPVTFTIHRHSVLNPNRPPPP